MLGRRRDKGKDVRDVYFRAERTALEEASDAEVVGLQAGGDSKAAERANFGEFVSLGKSSKSRNRKKHGGSKGRASPGSTPAIQVVTDVEQQEKQEAAVLGNPPEFANDDSLSGSASGAVEAPADCNGEAESEMVKGNNGQSKETEVHDRTQGGEESILQRLQRVIRGYVIPPVNEEGLESNLQEQADEELDKITRPALPAHFTERTQAYCFDIAAMWNQTPRFHTIRFLALEILALEAIYGEDFKRFNNEHIKNPSFIISVYVEIPENIALWADHPSSSESRSLAGTEDSSISDGRPVSGGSSVADSTHVFTVQSLPPLRLIYSLPVSYPSHSPPLFTLSSMWLNSSKLSRLCSALDNIWYEQRGQVVIYSWIEWLQTQTLSFIGISEKLELGPYGVGGEVCRWVESDERASSGCISFESDISRLLRHNEEKKIEEFRKALHTCYICFAEHLGGDFVRLPCQHNFCVGCMQTLATVHVKEGSVNKLNCPDISCRGSIPPYILKELLEEEVFQRWEDLVLQRSLDAMMDIVYCPRCETVCIEEEDNFVQCTKCFYTFCSLCRQSWHVGQECMSAESRLRVLQERQKGSKIGEEQRRKEQELINEMMNIHYVRREAKQCPKCKMAISKIEGCNKMVCSNCGQYFCFKCGKKIDGYDHFRDGSCLLFDAEEVVPRWQPEALLQQQQAQIELELWPELGRPCPNCRQLNVKLGNNNHIYCWACRSSYCCLCHKVVRRTSEHFGTGPNKCRQHTAG